MSGTAIGWREWAAIPSWGVSTIKAKVDTGARTSALHVEDLEYTERNGDEWVTFTVLPWQRNDDDPVVVHAPRIDRRTVTSSSGTQSNRPVVRVPVLIASVAIDAEITLTRRDEMGFRMLIGRQALRQGFVVDSARSYVGGRPPKAIRARNRKRA